MLPPVRYKLTFQEVLFQSLKRYYVDPAYDLNNLVQLPGTGVGAYNVTAEDVSELQRCARWIPSLSSPLS
eukprot:1799904-Rhodomonas_salina.2